MARNDVLTIRLEDGFKSRFNDLCDTVGVKAGELIESLVKDYYDCKVAIEDGHIVAKSEENRAYTETEEAYTLMDKGVEEFDYEYYGFDTLVRLFKRKEYPDDYIRRVVNDNIVASVYDMPKYNPRKRREEWEC